METATEAPSNPFSGSAQDPMAKRSRAGSLSGRLRYAQMIIVARCCCVAKPVIHTVAHLASLTLQLAAVLPSIAARDESNRIVSMHHKLITHEHASN